MQRFFVVAATLFAVALAAPSHAQFGGSMGGMGGMGGPPRRDPGGQSGARGPVMASGTHLIADIEQQLDNVRYQLKLRPEQENAWQSYQEKVGALVADQLRPAPREPQENGSALRQIDRKTDVVRNRLAAMEDIADAAHHLYEKLDEQQRATADRLLAATVPALYSGLGEERPGGRKDSGREGPEGRGPPPD